MANEMDFSELTRLSPRSNDLKAMTTAIVKVFESFKDSMLFMLQEIKSEFSKVAVEQNQQISEMKAEISSLRAHVNVLQEKIEDSGQRQL